MPGEVAPSHRHTPSALRFIVEGEGAYTAVAGEKLPMKPGDFVVTPAWAWHDHGNHGTTPVVWLDGLDTPFARFFGAAFREEHPHDKQPIDRPEGESISVYGMNLIPDEYQSDGLSTPVLIYPYERTRAALDSMAKANKPHPAHGFRLRYANPATGKHPFPTMAVSMQRLPKGFSGKTYRSTGSAVFAVHRGHAARRRSATRPLRSRRMTCSSRRRGSPTASRPTARSSCSAIPIAPARKRWATGASNWIEALSPPCRKIAKSSDRSKASRKAPARPSRENAEEAVRTLLRWAGDDPGTRRLAAERRARVVRAYEEWFAGYFEDPREYLKRTFEEVAGYDEIVLLRDIRFESHCEHHIAPIIGRVHIAYLPRNRVVGISKLAAAGRRLCRSACRCRRR